MPIYRRLNVHLEISPSFGDVVTIQVTPARSFPCRRPALADALRRHVEPEEPRSHRARCTVPLILSASALWPAGPSGSGKTSPSTTSLPSLTAPLRPRSTSSLNWHRLSNRSRRRSRCCETPAEFWRAAPSATLSAIAPRALAKHPSATASVATCEPDLVASRDCHRRRGAPVCGWCDYFVTSTRLRPGHCCVATSVSVAISRSLPRHPFCR